MTREWKPGDVAMIRTREHGELVGLRTSSPERDGLSEFFNVAGFSYAASNQARPLVVIDPEDREQVERLRRALIDARGGTYAEGIRIALREFANPAPPKPDEPTAKFSVVVDENGGEWVRALGPDFTDGWVHSGDLPSNGKWTDYRDIAAVRVLSEGVTP